MIINPYDIALYYLTDVIGFDFTSEQNAETGKLSADQTKDLKKSDAVTNEMIVSLNAMLKKLTKSKNFDDINWSANLQNHLIMHLVPVVVEEIDKSLSNGSHIKWIASFAKEIDPIHALNYGHTMTWGTAKKKELGTRPNCKCSFEVVNWKKQKELEKNLTLEGVNLVEKTQ
jgi:hypothetical protein